MAGIPVVLSGNGIGIPVRPTDNDAPVMTIASNGIGTPIVITELGTPFIVQGFEPVNWDFQTVTMTAEDEGQWVGYSDGGVTRPQPAFGSLSAQPTAVTPILALYNDTASGRYLAVFQGNYLLSLQGVKLIIGGFPISSYELEIISGNTWVRFPDGIGNMTPGNYEVTFGF